MSWLFGILAVVAWVFFGVFFVRTRRMLRDLGQSLEEERRFLLEDPSTYLQKMGFPELVKKINRLADRCSFAL